MEEILTKWSCLTYNRTLVGATLKLSTVGAAKQEEIRYLQNTYFQDDIVEVQPAVLSGEGNERFQLLYTL